MIDEGEGPSEDYWENRSSLSKWEALGTSIVGETMMEVLGNIVGVRVHKKTRQSFYAPADMANMWRLTV